MAGTYTTRTGKLYKPAVGDDVNVATDINANMDVIDTYGMGFVQVANSGSRPTTVWPGLCIFQTDDSTVWVSNGSSPASGSWFNIPNTTSQTSSNITTSATGDNAVTVNITGDGNKRLSILGGGRLEWGTGGTVADTNLYRSAGNTLKTDDSFVAALNLGVGGDVSAGGGVGVVSLKNAGTEPTGSPSGGLILYADSDSRLVSVNPSGSTYRMQGSQEGGSVTTLTNTTTETTLLSVVIPANEVINDGVYRLTVQGVLSTNTSGTNQINLRTKQSGLPTIGTGNYTCSNSLSSKPWVLESTMRFRNPGGSASLFMQQRVTHKFDAGGPTADSIVLFDSHTSTAGVSVATSSPLTISVTGQWSAASANNKLEITGWWFERVV